MKSKSWPKGWKVPKGAAAIIFYPNGEVAAQIPKQKEYEPDSPGEMVCVCLVAMSAKMTKWRRRFIREQFAKLKEGA